MYIINSKQNTSLLLIESCLHYPSRDNVQMFINLYLKFNICKQKQDFLVYQEISSFIQRLIHLFANKIMLVIGIYVLVIGIYVVGVSIDMVVIYMSIRKDYTTYLHTSHLTLLTLHSWLLFSLRSFILKESYSTVNKFFLNLSYYEK